MQFRPPRCRPAWTACVVVSCLVVTCLIVSSARAAEHSARSVEAAPPEGLSPEVAERLGNASVEVLRGGSRAVCQIWLSTELKTAEDFVASAEVLYPFEIGELIGVIRFPRRGSDFRGQRIDAGLYTLRYAQQPVDGNHVGTSPTRDFFCLVRAEDDVAPQPLDAEKLNELSAAAAGSTHPLLLCLQKAGDDGQQPELRHDEDHDWWIVRLTGQAVQGGRNVSLPIELVVVGQAAE